VRVPGSHKNPLDWLMRGPEIAEKPMGVLTTSRYSGHAPAALRKILRTMAARVLALEPGSSPLDERRVSYADVLADAELAKIFREALETLRDAHLAGL
jgi:NAD(P)H-dependent FMN reductase